MAVDGRSGELNRTSPWVVLAFFLAALGHPVAAAGQQESVA